MDEVHTAVGIGYGLLDVFEFWEYSVTFFKKHSYSGGFFQSTSTCS